MTEHRTAHFESPTQTLQQLQQALADSKSQLAASQAAERQVRAMLNDFPIGLAISGEDGYFFEANRVFCETLGYTRDEILQLTYLDVTHPDDRETDMRLRARLKAGDVPSIKWEKRYVRKDGAVVWASFHLAFTRLDDGEPQCFLVAMENISQRRTLEESLYRIATNLAQSEAMALSGTWDWDIETDEVVASAETLDLFGLPPTSPSMKLAQFLDRVDPRDRATLASALKLAAAERKPYQLRYRLLLPDDSERVVMASGEIYQRTDAGTPQIMVGIVQDITLQHRTEQALIESERRFRLLFDDAVDGIVITDQHGVYLDANRSACHMLGYTRDELIGKQATELLPPDQAERLTRERDYFLASADHTRTSEWELKHKDGHFIPVEASARLLPDRRWMAILRDISERRRTIEALNRYNAEVRDLYDNAPCGYHTIDRDCMLTQINETALRWLGYGRDEVIGKKKLSDLLTASSKTKLHANMPRLMEHGRLQDVEFELERKDGSTLPVLISATATYDRDGVFQSSRMSIFDMTDLNIAQQKLRQAAAVFEHTTDAILITDADGVIVAANKAFASISGYEPEEVVGKKPGILKSGVHDQDFYDALWTELTRTGSWQGEIWNRKKSGETFPVWQSITMVKDGDGRVTDYISVFSDITTIKENEQRLTRLAYHDSMTGLPNRLLFDDRIAQALAHGKRHHARAALMLLDIDRFKAINDTYGHPAGDALLKTIAARLKNAIRSEDTVARLSGDEFAIILGDIDDPGDVALMARKVGRLISEPIVNENQVLTVTSSIGIGIYPDDADHPKALAKCADAALYEVKNKGRAGYQFYTPEMTATASESLQMDRDLRRALKANELSLVYQPQFSLASGRVVGVEALARWNRPDHGPQSPARFMKIAEETDLIESIGEWAIDTALEQLGRWRAAGIAPIRMAINLSERQVRRARFMEDMHGRLAALHAQDGFGVDIELTETTLRSEAETVETLMTLKSMGLKIAVDDFGTGYSSLNSLMHLPVDILKIDSSFIHGIPTDPDGRAITTAIIAMGHSLGMNVIAEGVETEEQLAFVRSQHCDEAQGFLFSRPLEADQCLQFLMAGHAVPSKPPFFIPDFHA